MSDMHIHEVSKDAASPPIHLLPMYVRYRIITSTTRTCNNARINLQKISILKQYAT